MATERARTRVAAKEAAAVSKGLTLAKLGWEEEGLEGMVENEE